ncbi:MAG: hypothetical protein ABIZ70_12855 [Gemmatimonadales bacterium]
MAAEIGGPVIAGVIAKTSAGSAFALSLMCSLANAQQPAVTDVPGLGALRFPVTTSSANARTAFLRGTMLLHLFHYDEAVAAYRSAERLDPGMTMAFWGEAMASNYGVWDEQFLDSARAALVRLAPTASARAAKARSQRERDYLAAVEVLFGAGAKPHRDTLYANAMAGLARRYPDDDEAKLFHALALLSLNQGVRDTVTYRRAYLIANDVLRRQPAHSGAAHYVIHATDDPDHADAGLAAARSLARTAPAADHAQHMTSHIFMARGMWQDLVAANQRATHSDASGHTMPGMTSSKGCGHYNSWLHYGYLSLGRTAEASALLQQCQARAARDSAFTGDAIAMWSRQLLDSEGWSGPLASWRPSSLSDSYDRQSWHFSHGYAAAKRGDTATAAADLKALRQANADAAAALRKAGTRSPEDRAEAQRGAVLEFELDGASRGAAGDVFAAQQLLRRAALLSDSIPYAFGPPFVDKPAHELLGEVLLATGRRDEAAREFARARHETPNRPLALRGAARAAARP